MKQDASSVNMSCGERAGWWGLRPLLDKFRPSLSGCHPTVFLVSWGMQG